MDNVTRDLKGVISIADDICVFGKDEREHDTNLYALLEKAKASGLVFNADKCNIKVPEISLKFFGMTYSENGVEPDQARIKEITNLPPTSNKQESQSVLGMVQYLSPFIPHLSDQTAPRRDLLRKDVIFTWTSHHKAFQSLKDSITSTSSLHFFNSEYETKIQVDASTKGHGAALVQVDPSKPDEERE